MKVLFISPSFYPATYYGGPLSLNHAMCESLSRNDDIQLQVLTTDADGPQRRIDLSSIEPDKKRNFAIHYCRRTIHPDISLKLLARLPAMIRGADVVHLNGVYSFTTIPTLALCRLMRKPVVWSTLGALQRWRGTRRERMKHIFERACDAFCEGERVVLHTASDEEEFESRRRINNVSSIVIPYGTCVPNLDHERVTHKGPLRLLFIGRLDPIKGIENLLRAMTLAKAGVTLSVCGEGDAAYEGLLRLRVSEFGLESRVRFHGAVVGDAKDQHFREADICVVPSFKESFGAVVTEALARAVPVIASRGTPWQKLEELGCGLWIGTEAEDLAQAINRAATMPLTEMGRRGREWMKRDFSWDRTAAKLIQTYRNLIDGRQHEDLKVIADPKAA
ncbi:MAG TPA: glycosyl transferase family 1 [Blastocatellia bacterium]|nr:glycosyl transferase family 1 [Blastocatellia bacterium]